MRVGSRFLQGASHSSTSVLRSVASVGDSRRRPSGGLEAKIGGPTFDGARRPNDSIYRDLSNSQYDQNCFPVRWARSESLWLQDSSSQRNSPVSPLSFPTAGARAAARLRRIGLEVNRRTDTRSGPLTLGEIADRLGLRIRPRSLTRAYSIGPACAEASCRRNHLGYHGAFPGFEALMGDQERGGGADR